MWIDFRQEKRIHPLKGPAGSVRSIARHPDHHDHVCAVGLDRHLYLFDTKTNLRKQKVILSVEDLYETLAVHRHIKSVFDDLRL